MSSTHRYWLQRSISMHGTGAMGFVMLNPSTADATQDDPTIRRCRSFADREGCARLYVVNLWAKRATNPDEITHDDLTTPPTVPELQAWSQLLDRDDLRFLVAAWGRGFSDRAPLSFGARCLQFRQMAHTAEVPVHALGFTKGGHPRHPLYVRGDEPLVLLKPNWEGA